MILVLGLPLLCLPPGLVGCGGSNSAPAAEVLPLAVLGTVPADGAVAVAPDLGVIVVDFDTPLDPTSLAADSIRVTGPAGVVPGSIYLAVGGESLHFVPSGRLGYLLQFEVVVDANLANLTGGTLGTAHEFGFKTVPIGAAAVPPFFFGSATDSVPVECLMIGDMGTEPPAGATFTTGDAAVATVSDTGLITLVGPGVTTIAILMDGIPVDLPVAVADDIARGTAYLCTGAQYLYERDPDVYHLHTWDLSPTGTVEDGGYDQYDTVWQIDITNHTASLSASFPEVGLSEVTYDTPYAWHDSFRLERDRNWNDEVRGGEAAGHLRPLGESHVYQQVTLPAAPTTLTLTWYDRIRLDSVFGEEIGARLVVEDLTGGSGTTQVWARTDSDEIHQSSWTERSVDLLPWAGETVRLRWELVGGDFEDWGGGFIMDDATLLENDTIEHLVNGDFEAGLTGWTGGTYLVPREVNLTPADPVAELQVTRSIYAPYEDGYWLRYLDTFHNPGTTAVDVTIRFEGDLGSDGSGITYTAHGGRAVLEFDGSGSDPALGMLPGSATLIDAPNLDGEWSCEYDLSIGPGQSVSILAFHLFGNDTLPLQNAFLGVLARDMLDNIDALGSDSPYLVGLTSAELARVVNWP